MKPLPEGMSDWFPFPPTLPGWYEVLPLSSVGWTPAHGARWKKIYGYTPRLQTIAQRHWDGSSWSDPVEPDATHQQRIKACQRRRLPRQLNTSTLWRGRLQDGWPPRPLIIREVLREDH